jgi:hypothetical protein
MKATSNVLKALQVTMAAIGADVKPEQVRVIAAELAHYPEAAVLGALARCKLECRFRLALADVIERIDDGHLGPEEAWALVPKSEADSAVLTQEIMGAIPFDLIGAGDLVAARMAFRESYTRALAQARAEKTLPEWFASLGHDVGGRVRVVEEAMRLGRLGVDQAQHLLPHHELRDGARLTAPTPVGKLLADLRRQ